MAWHGMAWHAFPPHVTINTPLTTNPQLMFLFGAFKICEAAGVQPVYTQLFSTLLPAVLLSARPGALA